MASAFFPEQFSVKIKLNPESFDDYNEETKKSRKAEKCFFIVGPSSVSLEKVCVPCAVNRDGKSIAQIANLGRASVRSISSVFGGRISPDAVLCTDKHNAYVGFAEREGINLLQLKSTQRASGTLGIQHINGYHSQLKTFMERFHGVATKYLNNYLVWHNLRNYAEGDFNFKESVWERHNAEAIYDDSKWTYMFRPPIPLPLAA